jgi:hypothetical protein
MKLTDVDPVKCPHLYAALRRGQERQHAGWVRVMELRRAGQDGSADRLVRKLLGVQGEPMTEEKKEYLDNYKVEHKDEIRERQQQRQEIRRRTLALLTTGKKKR